MWVRSWLEKRNQLGAFHNLIAEMQLQDATGFQNFCRLSVGDLEHLLGLIGPQITRRDTRLRAAISAKERLLVTLRFLATGDSYRSLMYLFRIADSTICKIVPEVCTAIAALRNQFIQLPASPEEWRRVAQEYSREWNFPHCVGALDGKHIVMQAPPNSGSFYYNYKNSHSIVLLALVDAKYRFLYCDVGANGKSSDGGVFKNSTLFTMLNDKTLGLPDCCPLPGRVKASPYVVVADDAFPLTEYLLKPYPSTNQPAENRIFNYRLSRARRVVENVFGHIAQRFRVLPRPLLVGPTVTDQLVTAVCVLHNLLSQRNVNYAPPSAYDREDPVSRKQIDGEWRGDVQDGTYFPLQRGLANRSSEGTRHIREEFRNYFTSTLGEVAWQWQFI